MHLISRVIVATSVAPWTPDLTPLRVTLESLARLDAAETVVVADALPAPGEAETLDDLDGGKWRDAWAGQRDAYDAYLEKAAALCAARPRTTLDRRPSFGHLAGSVRAGLDGLADDAVVFVTQHDLRLCAAPPAARVAAALRDKESPVDYVLLDRDADGSPRFAHWFGDAPRADGWLRDLRGGFSDQAHFATAGWYRRHVLPAVGDAKTCMEHVLHAAPVGAGGAPKLSGGTYALAGGPHVLDLVHGTVTDRPDAHCGETLHWRPAGNTNTPRSAWARVFFDGRRARGALDGGEELPSAWVAEAPPNPAVLWRSVPAARAPARAVALRGGTALAARGRGGAVESFDARTGAPGRVAELASPVLALAGGAAAYAGTMDKRVIALDDDLEVAWSRRGDSGAFPGVSFLQRILYGPSQAGPGRSRPSRTASPSSAARPWTSSPAASRRGRSTRGRRRATRSRGAATTSSPSTPTRRTRRAASSDRAHT